MLQENYFSMPYAILFLAPTRGRKVDFLYGPNAKLLHGHNVLSFRFGSLDKSLLLLAVVQLFDHASPIKGVAGERKGQVLIGVG